MGKRKKGERLGGVEKEKVETICDHQGKEIKERIRQGEGEKGI
jgi:hypothetical protein